VGNLVDRVFRAPGPLRGHVVDFLELPHWPVFNVADAAIVTGGVLAVLLAVRGQHLDGTRAGAEAPDEATGHEGGADEGDGGEGFPAGESTSDERS